MYSSRSGDMISNDFKIGTPLPPHYASNFDGHSSCDNGEKIVAWLIYRWKLFNASQSLPRFSRHWSSGSADITYVFFHVFSLLCVVK